MDCEQLPGFLIHIVGTSFVYLALMPRLVRSLRKPSWGGHSGCRAGSSLGTRSLRKPFWGGHSGRRAGSSLGTRAKQTNDVPTYVSPNISKLILHHHPCQLESQVQQELWWKCYLNNHEEKIKRNKKVSEMQLFFLILMTYNTFKFQTNAESNPNFK